MAFGWKYTHYYSQLMFAGSYLLLQPLTLNPDTTLNITVMCVLAYHLIKLRGHIANRLTAPFVLKNFGMFLYQRKYT